MRNATPRPRSRRSRNATSRLLSALNRMIAAARQAERARDDLLRESARRQEVARAE